MKVLIFFSVIGLNFRCMTETSNSVKKLKNIPDFWNQKLNHFYSDETIDINSEMTEKLSSTLDI